MILNFSKLQFTNIDVCQLCIFYETFNSITLAEPLRIAFDETYEKYKNINDAGIGYNLLELAFTLIRKEYKINEL